MSKAYLNALHEEGTREEIFDWLCKLDAEVDNLRAQLKPSTTHGERVIARKKYDGHDTYLNGNPDMEQWVHDNK